MRHAQSLALVCTMRGDTVQNIHTRDVCRMHYADERSKCRRTKNPSHPTIQPITTTIIMFKITFTSITISKQS